MKTTLKLVAASFLFTACGSQKATVKKDKTAADYAKTITSSELKEMLYTYASDEFAGRQTGEEGQKKAVNYLRKHYKDYGVPAAKKDGDYFQKVPLIITEQPSGSITVNGKAYNHKDQFVSLTAAETTQLTPNDIVFVNYGIDDSNYSDYKNINVKDKVVLFKNGEPKNTDGSFVISGTRESSKWSKFTDELNAKKEAAQKHGAKAILFYNPKIYNAAVAYFAGDHSSKMRLKGKSEIHYFLINTDLATALLPSIEYEKTAKTFTTDAVINYKNNSRFIDSENVAAYIKGSEKPEEVIVISAHLDHIGTEDGEVFNGADDDGSGTIAILEMAEAFAKAKKEGNGPKRSILFLNVTAEEKGLLGSKYYTDNDPIFPLKNTIANLNIDMIGRIDPKRKSKNRNYLYLIGSDKLSTQLHNVSEETNKNCCNIELDYKFNADNDPNRFYYRSDHYNFAKNNVPVIFYFNGTHDDYHQPTDTPDKIQYDLLENRTRLIFHTAWELANRPERITVDKQ